MSKEKKFNQLWERYHVDVWRKVARMYFISGYSPEYIARNLGVSIKESTVDHLISKIMRNDFMLREFCPEKYKLSNRYDYERIGPYSIDEMDYGTKSYDYWSTLYQYEKVKYEFIIINE